MKEIIALVTNNNSQIPQSQGKVTSLQDKYTLLYPKIISKKQELGWDQSNFFNFHLQAYKKAGFVCYELARNGKKPLRKIDKILSGEENISFKEIFETYKDKKCNLGIALGRSRLIVIDCDSEKAIEWFESQNFYKDTAKVITKRGQHYYYFANFDTSKYSTKQFKPIDIDIILNRQHITAPPSQIDSFVYLWDLDLLELNNLKNHIKELSEEEFEAILKGIEEENEKLKGEKKKIAEERLVTSFKDHRPLEKIDRIVSILKEYYTQGNRQTICLAIAGFCRKLGLDQEICKEYITALYHETGDKDPITQRLSAVTETYNKDPEKVASITLLKDLITQENYQEIKSILQYTTVIKDFEVDFIVKGKSWHAIYITGSGDKKRKVEKKICDFFKIIKRFEDEEGNVSFLIRTWEGEEKYVEYLDLRELQKAIGGFVIHEKLTKMLINAMRMKIPKPRLYKRTGWIDEDRTIFLHPAFNDINQRHRCLVNISGMKERDFIPKNTEKQHEIVRKILKEGKLLGAKVVFAVASLFDSFTVLDSAPKGTGKTLTSKFAVQLFYRLRDPMTTNATFIGMELTLKSLKDLPALFDECSLTFNENIQNLIFMVKFRTGKARATKTLNVRTHELGSVVFLTGEHQINFDKLGAFRRFLSLFPDSWEDYTNLDITEIVSSVSTCWGCGLDYIRHYIQKKNVFEEIPIPNQFPDFFSIYPSVMKTVILLEDFYNDSFLKLKETINSIFQEQNEKVNIDIVEQFITDLKNFIADNLPYFITSTNTPTRGVWGEIEDLVGHRQGKSVYILSHVFDDFCSKKGYIKRNILKQARERGILNCKEGRLSIAKRIGGLTYNCYNFIVTDD